ncbi:hypothetical protein G6O69_37185 [Pseudenhygromyxa sp. WMMC2535]|uniref:hypothetical protein n=1 Tax=Pseudenhygromyxa sp. WMMC2535 TaxID=2712867 RepID=UPI001552E52D|nr:hypothetical protein [Pseudenhygromyxa sp. WMMC2535]NVB40304.1 hypothetical protein [Pseudenhygromyxa sp. WMMC2535]NVB43513.1 hypothetical protein [Pseudenhygromyxa sp. WMMC2535]
MSPKLPLALTTAALLGVVVSLLTPGSASAQYRDLCDSTQVCDYTGPNAPVLDADVCLDQTGQTRLKGSTPCPAGQVPFHVRYGELLDPVELLVVAYTPLENACSIPGLCDPGDYAPGETSTAQAICCFGNVCWPGVDCGGTLMWCDDGVCNEDGTITCFEGMEF